MKFNQWHPTTLLSMNFLALKFGLLVEHVSFQGRFSFWN